MRPGVLVWCATACALYGQGTDVELFGAVRDPAGLPVPGASVAAQHTGAGAKYAAVSGARGEYRLAGMAPGRYRITVTKEGFRTLERAGVELKVGDRKEMNLPLEIGEMSERVEVTAAAPLLEAARGAVAFAAEQKKVASLPLDGRNFIPLIALAPGVMLPPGSVLPRINGSRPRVNEYLYDGVSVLQPEPGQAAYYPVLDAIQEFRVEVNSYSAEYGRSNGGVILVSQKSGTNEWRGTAFEFLRNEVLNARNVFAAGGAKPRFRRNQYGFVLGGPVQTNRTFLFADWQGSRLGTGVVRMSTVPTAAERQGVFRTPVFDPAARERFPNDTIPASRVDRAAASLAGRYPLPSLAGAANNYRRLGADRTDQDQFDTRVDRYWGSRHRVFARYTFLRDDSRPTAPLPDGSGNLSSGVIADTTMRAGGVAAEHTWTLSPRAVNQARFGFTRRGFERRALALPSYNLSGYQQLGPPASGNGEFATSVTQVTDAFSRFSGGHSLKVGADIRVERLDVLLPPNPLGAYSFTPVLTSGGAAGAGNSFASFLLGQVQEFSLDVQRETLQPRAKIAEFFVQEDRKISPRWSLNLGVRYTLNFPSTEARDRGAVFNLGAQKLDFLGKNGYPRTARDLEKTNFGPRAGVAVKVMESLVARAGYGLTWIEQAGITTPFTTPLFPFIRTVGQRSLDNLRPAFVLADGPAVEIGEPGPDSSLGQGAFAVQRDQKSGYAQQWNFTLQKTLGTNWSVEAGYLGSKLTNLGVPDVNLNQLPAGLLKLGARLTEAAPNPFFGQIPASSSLGGPTVARQQLLRPYPRFTTVTLYRNNVGHSTYHSFQARVERRYARGLTFTAAYTFSRLIDDAGAVFDAAILTGPVAAFQAADSYNRRLEKDVSTGNIPHVWSAGFVWESRAGWQVAGIARIQSGSPVAVTQATNFNAFAGFGIQRPNRVADPTLPAAERTTGRWFNTAAFTVAPAFTLGTSSRNPVTGPGYRTLDLTVGKTFRFGERWRLESRIEAFNVTNTPPLGNPNGSFGAPDFGSITTALDPRVFELVMKVHF